MITKVQQLFLSTVSGVYTQVINPSSECSTGDLLLVFGSSSSVASIPVITVSDSLDNVYHQFGNTLTVAQGVIMWLFYAISNTTASNVINVNYSIVMPGPTNVSFVEWSGRFSGDIDGYSMRSNAFGTFLSTNYIPTINADDLLLSTFFHSASNVVTPNPGWSQSTISSSLGYAWQETMSPGVYRYASSQNTSAPWGAVLWSFKVAPPPGSSTIILNVTTSYLQGTSFKEVYPNRVPEDIYDSLEETPNFVYNQLGPNYNGS